jgi:hypothetical protein
MRATVDGSPALPALHADAVAVSAFRALPDGTGRAYTVSEATSGNKWRAINHLLRMARACGYARPSCGDCDCYAVLDILDDNEDVIQDFCIPTNRAFGWWYRKLHLRVVDVEAEVAKFYGRDA